MIKRNSIILSFLFLFAISGSVFAATPIAPITEDFQLITLRAGTVVSVELMEELNPHHLSAGNAIDLMVRTNVVVNGKVVIATGAIAEGMVKKVVAGCNGDCTEVTITVENVQAVDGQRVYLRSVPHVMKTKCCYGKKYKKGGATLTIGTKISSRVLNDIKINA